MTFIVGVKSYMEVSNESPYVATGWRIRVNRQQLCESIEVEAWNVMFMPLVRLLEVG